MKIQGYFLRLAAVFAAVAGMFVAGAPAASAHSADAARVIAQKLYGKIRITPGDGSAIKVRIVSDGSEDFRVRRTSAATRAGQWQIVNGGEDFRVRFVDGGEDIRVRFVESGEGVMLPNVGQVPAPKKKKRWMDSVSKCLRTRSQSE